ncbi:MAG: phosphotransferase [Ktedonobacteraceae bacterium]
MLELTEMIAAYIAGWDYPFLLQAIFGTTEPLTIAGIIDTFCASELGSSIAQPLFFECSQGAVFGLLLHNHQRIVIKAHHPRRSTDFLNAVVRVQHHLTDHGYPCPRPLLDVRPLSNGLANVEELIDEGIYTDAHDPAIRRSMAEMLAWLINLTRNPESIPGLHLSALDRRLPPALLWPIPHNAIFNFKATTAGAEWIDDLAQQAKEVMSQSPGEYVLGHTDWSVKHLRYLNGHVCVIYDWDSLALDIEPVFVGDAARGFTMTWFLDVPILPTRAEAQAFINEYECARGKSFSADEYKTIAAAATYGLAYGARCEHSLQPLAGEYPPGSCRDLLKRYGNAFLPY